MILSNDMLLIKQTNKGEIKIYKHPLYGLIGLCNCTISFELAEKYCKKNGARIPHASEMNSINFRPPTIEEINSIKDE